MPRKKAEPAVVNESLQVALEKIKQRKQENKANLGFVVKLRELQKELTELKSEMKDAKIEDYVLGYLRDTCESLKTAVGHLTWTPPEPKQLPRSCYYAYDQLKGPGVCAIDIDGPDDRTSRSRCPGIRLANGNMCRSDCDYWCGSEEQVMKYITKGQPLTVENTSSMGGMVHVYEFWK